MNFAPYQWRAGEGYLPPPGSIPMPVYPQLYYYPAYQPPPPFAYPAGPVIAVPPAAAPSSSSSSAPPKPPTPPKKEPKPKAPADDAKTVAHSLTPSAAPTCLPGVNYMHPRAHTKLHVFNKAAAVWDEKYQNQQLAFKIFKVSTGFTVQEVVERVLKKKPEGEEKWAVTEVVEGGGGEWVKGSTIEHGSDRAKGTLASMGWDERKGSEGVPPVWLVVHKL